MVFARLGVHGESTLLKINSSSPSNESRRKMNKRLATAYDAKNTCEKQCLLMVKLVPPLHRLLDIQMLQCGYSMRPVSSVYESHHWANRDLPFHDLRPG